MTIEYDLMCECNYCQADNHPCWQWLFDERDNALIFLRLLRQEARDSKNYELSDRISIFLGSQK